ncbi:MAG: preprotein translocase subunit SecA [Phycisphaerae bacterium]|nr:preprotein translocase subunit SecA [Phycisphaerae bacterium]
MSTAASTTWQMLSQNTRGKELPKGLDAAWDRAAGVVRRMSLHTKAYLARAQRVVKLEGQYKDVADAALRGKLFELRETFRRERDTAEHLEHAFAMIRETASRQVGMKPFPVQIAGAMVMSEGGIAEMATGEGKTLTATLPAVIAGWRGRGCHIVTTNDYLAKRDAETMGRIYRACGVRCAYIEQEMAPPDRKRAYQADVTYCTNKEISADYLRDRLALGRIKSLPEALLAKIAKGAGSGTDRLVQRGLFHAIVDEVDSILIDEAVTPLIISGEAPNAEQVEAFNEAAQLAAQLEPKAHYKINPRYREIEFTNAGRRKLAELAAPLGGVWSGARRREELVNQALTARVFYQLEKQYVIQEDKIVIVDEFTGRLMPDREWRDGLHQAVSAKEQLEVQAPKDTYARISFQRFFRLYRRLCGMTGTAAEARTEFWQIYHMPVVVIPTNRPCIRTMNPDHVYATEDAKFTAIVERIETMHRAGRPVLIGTRSVRTSEHIGRLLEAKGLDCQILNAVRHKEEAEIVAQAGQPGRITVATNMAGRGTDIKLGRGVAEMGGLHVIATERHEARRIDRQLFGRCARQGDPGSAEAFVALEDELVARHTPHLAKSLQKRHGKTKTTEISSKWNHRLFDHAQKKAQRQALRQRKGVLKNDDWLDEYLGFAGREH